MMNGEREVLVEKTLDFRFFESDTPREPQVDFSHIIGQQFAKRALEIAAA